MPTSSSINVFVNKVRVSITQTDEKHFIRHSFTIEHFITLMCHLFVMVCLGNDDSSNGDKLSYASPFKS